jgi:2-polyprenyl-6-methoxyphenol hydroxylase-like FAD-dependent oxidoreductase
VRNSNTGAPQVLIAGAGPVGLSLAITCRRFGVPVRIIDRATQRSQVSKALAVWSGTLEAFDAMGLMPGFLGAGVRLHALSAGTHGRQVASLKVGVGIDSPYPFPLLLPQSRTEELLGRHLATLGAEIERGVELLGCKQDADGVTAMLRHQDGREESLRTRYLVGCDGARSTLRHALNIAFEGYTEPQICLLADARIDGRDLDPTSIHLWWQNGGTVALFPVEDGIWRIFVVRSEGGEQQPTLPEIQTLLDRHGPGGLRLRDATWLSTFRINERLAARYRDGRCFLAGDAAHIHSPAGGQGMNTGIQDGVNLGWKLAHVLNGVGEADLLLDSYEAERRPVAREVVKASAQKLHVTFGQGILPKLLKNVVLPVLLRVPAVQRAVQVDLSETAIVYRDGPLVELGAPAGRPRRTDVGTRALDAGYRDRDSGETRRLWTAFRAPKHTLLLFGGMAAPQSVAAAGAWLQLLHLDAPGDAQADAPTRYRMPGPGWVLIRPDQVIAARGDANSADRLAAYIRRVLQPQALAEVSPARHAA